MTGNWLDLTIIIFLLITVAGSFRRGFISSALELLGFIIALFSALNLYFLISALLVKFSPLPRSFTKPIGFFVIWFVIESLYYFLARQLLKLIPKEVLTAKVNRWTSSLPSLANGFLILAFALLLFVSFPTPGIAKQYVLNSQIGGVIVRETARFQKPVEQIFGQAIEESLTFLTVKPQSRETVLLHFTQSQTSIDEKSEEVMFDLVNQERAARGIDVLEFDSKLQAAGRAHSQDMFARGYFSHYSPEGKDVGDRLESAGIFYLLAGENLALAPDVNFAHQGLMKSPGHRANILDNRFHKIGIGVVDGGIYGKMFTQVFTN